MAHNEEKFTIISAGQSNIDGRVPVPQLPNYLTLPLDHCYYCSDHTPDHEKGVFQDQLKVSDLTVKDGSSRWGFDLVTYYWLLHNTDLKDLHVIKCAEGGTSIAPSGEGGVDDSHWSTHIDQLKDPSHSLLLQFKQLIESCQAAQNNQLVIKAMLWHQGEGDRADFSSSAAANYYDNLKAVFAYCRRVVGNPQLPIFCGTVSHHSDQFDSQVEAGVIRLATEDPHIYLVDMQSGTLLDQFHFDAKSAELFGSQIFNAMVAAKVIEGEQLALPTVKIY